MLFAEIATSKPAPSSYWHKLPQRRCTGYCRSGSTSFESLPDGRWRFSRDSFWCAIRPQLYGNRIRREPLLLATLQEDVAWKAQMPRLFRSLTLILAMPLGQLVAGNPEGKP